MDRAAPDDGIAVTHLRGADAGPSHGPGSRVSVATRELSLQSTCEGEKGEMRRVTRSIMWMATFVRESACLLLRPVASRDRKAAISRRQMNFELS